MQIQIRVLARRATKFALVALAIGTLGIALEASLRGTLKSPEERVVTTLYSRPESWGGGRSWPVAIGTPGGQPLEVRTPVSLSDLPDHLVQAVLAVEDQRFYRHHGLDFRRIGGALFANVRAGGIRQGGSTLTQQLAKNLYLSSSRTLLRKAREAALALALESRYDKATILQAYLNEIYLGQDGARPIHGVGAAARYYFGKDVERIGLAESALLAGMIQAPNRHVPDRHPESARERRELVLTLMIDQLRVNGPAARRATRAALPRRVHPTPTLEARWFRDHLSKDLPRKLPVRGAAVFTTMDATLQRAAERAVDAGVRRLRRQTPGVEAALVALDPRTGDILAMVGGADYGLSQFNRATQARRQPGSAFKPIVALAALERGDRGDPEFTLASMVDDAPLSVRAGGEWWQPANYDGRFRGSVTFREAMEQSLNVPFARIGMQIGPDRIVAAARRLGLVGSLHPVPSLALGSSEVTLLELARAYGVFATQGVLAASRTVLGSTRQGSREAAGAPQLTRVADPAATYLVTSTLQGVVTRGTGQALNSRGRFEGMAGKTGTSNDWRDAWFVAYSPSVVVAVWVGRDDGESIGMSGATAALPIAAEFLNDIEPRNGWGAPRPPDGLVEAAVSAGTADWFGECGTTEVFLEGTEPSGQGCWGGEVGTGFRVVFGEGFRSEAILRELYHRWGDRLEGPAAELVEEVMEQVREAARERREARRGGQ